VEIRDHGIHHPKAITRQDEKAGISLPCLQRSVLATRSSAFERAHRGRANRHYPAPTLLCLVDHLGGFRADRAPFFVDMMRFRVFLGDWSKGVQSDVQVNLRQSHTLLL